jgi:hypothetical protein
MTKIFVATPAYGQVFYSPYVQSILTLIPVMQRRGWILEFKWVSHGEISEARNYLLTVWLDKTDASHILFIDNDMGFEPQLIVDMIEFAKPVVGAAYPYRRVNLHQVAKLGASEGPELAVLKAQDFVLKRARQGRGQRNFMQVEGCGAGILLIERSCMQAMLRAMPELSDTKTKDTNTLARGLDRFIRAFDNLRVDGRRLSEDFSFCHRWKNVCGGEIWVSIGHEITHIGLHEFKGRYADFLPHDPNIVVDARATTEPQSGR